MTDMHDGDMLVSIQQVKVALSCVAAEIGIGSHQAARHWVDISTALTADLREQFTSPSMQRVRPSLVAFVLLMEEKLRKHDMHSEKPKPWNTQEASSVIEHFEQELREFRREIDIFEAHPFGITSDMPHKASLEAADVANCLHVLVDKLSGCQYGPRGQGERAQAR